MTLHWQQSVPVSDFADVESVCRGKISSLSMDTWDRSSNQSEHQVGLRGDERDVSVLSPMSPSWHRTLFSLSKDSLLRRGPNESVVLIDPNSTSPIADVA